MYNHEKSYHMSPDERMYWDDQLQEILSKPEKLVEIERLKKAILNSINILEVPHTFLLHPTMQDSHCIAAGHQIAERFVHHPDFVPVVSELLSKNAVKIDQVCVWKEKAGIPRELINYRTDVYYHLWYRKLVLQHALQKATNAPWNVYTKQIADDIVSRIMQASMDYSNDSNVHFDDQLV